jgi:hypothetical protein
MMTSGLAARAVSWPKLSLPVCNYLCRYSFARLRRIAERELSSRLPRLRLRDARAFSPTRGNALSDLAVCVVSEVIDRCSRVAELGHILPEAREFGLARTFC